MALPPALTNATPARLDLGLAGNSLPTAAHLDFQRCHAAARDAVHAALDFAALAAEIKGRGWPCLRLHSQAADRRDYLMRPDRGRRLDQASELTLREARHGADIVFVLADGLCAVGVQRHALPVLDRVLRRLTEAGTIVGPICLVEQGRVAIGDPIGQALSARLTVVLIGERPGLSSTDSMGAYLTWDPKPGRTDAERNCLSNIREQGLGHDQAADQLIGLVAAISARRCSGVTVKAGDRSRALPDPAKSL